MSMHDPRMMIDGATEMAAAAEAGVLLRSRWISCVPPPYQMDYSLLCYDNENQTKQVVATILLLYDVAHQHNVNVNRLLIFISYEILCP